MALVVDASIAACWVLPDERHPAAEASKTLVAADGAVVPALWWFEVRNMLIVNERRRRIDAALVSEAIELLKSLPIEVDHSLSEARLMTLARAHGLTAYDAAYLELAERLDARLATLDKELAKAASAVKVRLVGGG